MTLSTSEDVPAGGRWAPSPLTFAFAPVRPLATNDAPPIGERAATRERSATEGGN